MTIEDRQPVDDYIDDLLEEYERTVAGYLGSLQLDFSALVIKGLKRSGLTQAALSACSGVQESTISRIVHSESNSTLETVAKLLHSLGIKPALIESKRAVATLEPTYGNATKSTLDTHHGIKLASTAGTGKATFSFSTETERGGSLVAGANS